MGDGEKRVRGRWVCAKEHLTFAFFSPRVCLVGQILLRQKAEYRCRAERMKRRAAEATDGTDKTAKGSVGLPGFV